MPQTIGIINGEVDATLAIQETESELIVPAILAREGVLSYQKGQMLRSADELKAALFTFQKAWVTAEKHPEPLISIITDRKKQIKGDLSDIRLDENAVMPNGKKSAAVKANVHLTKEKLTPQFIDDVKSGRKRDVSVGFLFDTVPEKGVWQGEPYDFKQENILINHVAVGVPVGRMRAPFIGLGCDTAEFEVADNLLPQQEANAQVSGPKPASDTSFGADPWETTEQYIRSGHRAPPEGGECRTKVLSEEQGIKAVICNYGGKWEVQSYLFSVDKWDMAKAKAWFKSHEADSVEQPEKPVDQPLPESPPAPAPAQERVAPPFSIVLPNAAPAKTTGELVSELEKIKPKRMPPRI